MEVKVDVKTGSLVSFTNKAKKITIPITSNFYYYQSDKTRGQESGAYIFNPTSKAVYPVSSSSTGSDG